MPVSKLGQIYSWLSLDVVIGAMVCNIMVFKLIHFNQIPWIQNVILGATVWAIYLLDHLWDVNGLSDKPTVKRRLFFYNNFKYILALAILLLAGIFVCSLFFLPIVTIKFGIVTGVLVLFYLAFVHLNTHKKSKNWFHKEILVGVLYGLGIWGSAAILSPNIEIEHYLLAVNFVFVAFLNLLIFSLYEIDEDLQQEQLSIVQSLGKDVSKKIIFGLAFFIFLLGILILIISQQKIVQNWVFLEWIMASVLLILILFPAYFKINETYRFIGDGVFILPAILWLANPF